MFKLSKIGIKNKIANDPYYRFQSLKEIAIAAELGIKIDVNQATIDDWLRLPGFSIHQGRSLVELVRVGVQLVCLEDIAAAIGVPVQSLQPYESVLTFAYYDRLSPLSPAKTHINTATVEELITIPQVTEALANDLIFHRQQQGKYRDIVELKSRLNLDSDFISTLMCYLQF
jgi:DNA uptake protein ComE-like DNA-binding protein